MARILMRPGICGATDRGGGARSKNFGSGCVPECQVGSGGMSTLRNPGRAVRPGRCVLCGQLLVLLVPKLHLGTPSPAKFYFALAALARMDSVGKTACMR